MKSITSALLLSSLFLMTIDCDAKKPKKEKPQHTIIQITDSEENEDEEHAVYRPNPVILNGVGQIMNGALSIAQDPHSRPNIGHSIAAMIHGIISIIIEKIAHKKMDPAHAKALEDCCDTLCSDISEEIAELIIARNFIFAENETH